MLTIGIRFGLFSILTHIGTIVSSRFAQDSICRHVVSIIGKRFAIYSHASLGNGPYGLELLGNLSPGGA